MLRVYLTDEHSPQTRGVLGSAWPCLASGKMQHLLTTECCCCQTRDETMANLLFGTTQRLLTDPEGHPKDVFDNLRVTDGDDGEPFNLATALSAMAEEGSQRCYRT